MESLVELIRECSREMEPVATGVVPKVGSMEGIRAVLFDIYGTLFISGVGDISLVGEMDREGAIRAALEAFAGRVKEANVEVGRIPKDGLAAAYLNIVQLEQEERLLDGVDFPEVDIRRVWQRILVELEILPEAEVYRQNEAIERLALDFELQVNPVWPMPGLEEVLRGLKSMGLKLGIVSNAQFFTPLLFGAFLKAPVEALGFTPEYCGYSYVYREAKPSTFLYDTVAAAMERQDGIQPREVLYVGNDRRNDVYPANAVGFRTALFAGDGRSLRWRQDDALSGDVMPDRVITDLRQITSMVSKIENRAKPF